MGLEWDRKLVAAHRDGYSVRATIGQRNSGVFGTNEHWMFLHHDHTDGVRSEGVWFDANGVSSMDGGQWTLRNRIGGDQIIDLDRVEIASIPDGMAPITIEWKQGEPNNRHPSWSVNVGGGEYEATVRNSWDTACWTVLINQKGYRDFETEAEAKTFAERKITNFIINSYQQALVTINRYSAHYSLREALSDHLGREFVSVYDCTRVWEAWSVGTMRQDDFVPLDHRIDEIVDGLMSVISSHGIRATDEAIDRAAMLIWAETRGVRRDIEARWSNIRDDAVVEPFIKAARAVFAQPVA